MKILNEAGRYQEALEPAKVALALRERTFGLEHREVASSLSTLGNLHRQLGSYRQAEPLLKQALAIREKLFGREHLDVTPSLNDLGVIYMTQGKYALAEPFFQRTLEIRQKRLGAEHPDIGRTLNNLGVLYWRQGKFAQAEPLYLRSLAIAEKFDGPEHIYTAQRLDNLALLYYNRGSLRLVEPLHQRALKIFERSLGPDHPTVATNLNNQAIFHTAVGDYGRAEQLHRRALAIRLKAFGREHPLVASSLSGLADVYKKQGELAKAEPFYRDALAIREQIFGAEHPDVGTTLTWYAELSLYQGNYTLAESSIRRALSLQEKVVGLEHSDVADTLTVLAQVLVAQNRHAEALPVLERAIRVQERNLAPLMSIGSELEKQEFLGNAGDANDQALSLHLQALAGNAEAARLAVAVTLQRKGRVLDVLSEDRSALRRRLDPQDQQLLDQLTEVRSQLAALVFKGASTDADESYKEVVARLQSDAEQLEKSLAERSAAFRFSRAAVPIEAVQPQIPADAALVEMVRYRPRNFTPKSPAEEWGKPRYAAYVLRTQGDPQWVDLGEAEALDKLAMLLGDLVGRQSADALLVRRLARTVDERIIGPIRSRLGGIKHLLLSPDGQLHTLPFGVLIDEQGRYLIENYTISYLNTGRELVRLQERATGAREAPLVMAAPDYGRSAAALPVSATGATTRSGDLGELQVGSLPGSLQEAKALAALLPGARTLTDAAATENALKQVQGPGILHLATHGFFLSDISILGRKGTSAVLLENPMLRSGLALAGFNRRESGGEDGVLTALEAANLDLQGTQLVVLSACDTGLGQIYSGEGVYGLRRAFAIAGARSQVLSMWRVDDQSTQQLMAGFYRNLLAGRGRSEALRQEQLKMLGSKRYQHPYYWGAFIASGDWRPLGKTLLTGR
ncbi:CHAT domain-containing tetratricopeptide repeat protein [Gloeobacter morelensis]|uniref:CHAT domain-containing protein n=1 Tax=Gloeobacter morelensis MG652769 TaxID=2781736 RepID=A0ABY3PMU5_9CYAN|nr:CHAT domain-containing tetratricopeptide repeat protein [Gloeobacter morelensis]UFP95018.1 CHAT domain-containing protein [Gloeobacter morelensis MG652769]